MGPTAVPSSGWVSAVLPAPAVPAARHRRAAIAAAVLLPVLALAGCSGKNAVDSTAANPKNYVAGDGNVQTVATSGRHAVHGLSGRTLDGSTVNVDDWAGDVVVVNFWASWCPPCRSESASLQAVAEATRSLGVRFLGIDSKDDSGNAKAFLRTHQVTYPSLFDQPGRLGLLFSPTASTLPTTIILDRHHREAARISGEARYTQLLSLVRKIAAESAA
jgi:thiol-disulfide isomerase/thioredoxin